MDATTATLARYAAGVTFEGLTAAAVHATARRLIDALGCGLGGFEGEPAVAARAVAAGRSALPPARVLGSTLRTTPEAACFANGAAIRYLDANDQYQGALFSGHPSDVLSAVLAAADVAGAAPREVVAATVVGYEVFGALAEVLPLRNRGWDQGVMVAPATALAAGRLLGLTEVQLGEAVAIAATAYVPTRQTRTGHLSMWKGAATSAAAQGGLWAALLAREGMTGPTAAYEGEEGVWQMVTGPFTLDHLGTMPGGLAVERANYKAFAAEYHAQALLSQVLELRRQITADQVAEVHIQTYGYLLRNIAVGAEKWDPQTRETADHSLPYILAAAWVDGHFGPASLTPERIADPALRPLMAKMTVVENPELSAQYPAKYVSELVAVATDGRRLTGRTDYPKGHAGNPMTDGEIEAKFRGLCAPLLGEARCAEALSRLWAVADEPQWGPLLDLLELPGR